MTTLTVEAVPGRKLPMPRTTGEFVGYRKVRKDDAVEYEASGPVQVPNDAYHRKALRRGDLHKPKAARRRSKED